VSKKPAISLPPRFPDRLTRAGKELMRRLEDAKRPVVSSSQFAAAVLGLYRDRDGLMLRHLEPDVDDVTRLRTSLRRARILDHDRDYGYRAYRLIHLPDGSAEEICCLIDPGIYISHLSAMQRYGLTNRRPKELLLSRPDPRKAPPAGPGTQAAILAKFSPKTISHPKKVRGRDVRVFHTAHPGVAQSTRTGFDRIASVGQTFLDTLEEPALCGGMAHVLDVWRRHAPAYFELIVPVVDAAPSKLAKVRAGYILEEVLGVNDARIMAWQRFAQRGGSQLLDPAKPYAPVFSERWMLSLNVR
jgi:predicted transcriptional regulator of viral defense system